MVKVSVIIPAYNSEKYIGEAIKSVLDQDVDFELIVVDDASTDRSVKIIKEIAKKDKRVSLVKHEENKGRAAALNTGLGKAKGKYIVFLDADDIMTEERLKKQTEFLDSNQVDMIYGDFEILDENKIRTIQAISFGEFEEAYKVLLEASKRADLGKISPHKLLDKNGGKIVPSCSVMLRREVFDKCKFDEQLRNSEDYDLWFQIIGKGFRIARLPIITYRYRQHEQQKSKDKEKMLIAARYINEKLKRKDYFK